MGLLARIAMKAEQKRLMPFFRKDEHFLQTDVCELVAVEFVDGARGQTGTVALTLTNRAIYVRHTKGRSAEAIRIPYERVSDLLAKAGLLEIVTFTADWLFRDIGSAMGSDKYTIIAERLRGLENVRRLADVPGGSVAAICRPTDEGKAPEWIFQMAQGVDIAAPHVRAALREHLASEFAKYGDPWAD